MPAAVFAAGARNRPRLPPAAVAALERDDALSTTQTMILEKGSNIETGPKEVDCGKQAQLVFELVHGKTTEMWCHFSRWDRGLIRGVPKFAGRKLNWNVRNRGERRTSLVEIAAKLAHFSSAAQRYLSKAAPLSDVPLCLIVD